MAELPKDPNLGNLSAELKAVNRTNLDDMRSALRLLNRDAAEALDRNLYPSRQAWRAAQRAADKADK